MTKSNKSKNPFYSSRGSKCQICNKFVNNLNRHNESMSHINMMNKTNESNFEYRDIIEVLKMQKTLIDKLIFERTNVKKIFNGFKYEMIDMINRCTEFVNKISMYEKNILFSEEIKNLSSSIKKSTNNLFVLRSEKSETDCLMEELEPIKEDKEEKVINIQNRQEDINLLIKPNIQKPNSKLLDDIKVRGEFLKKFGVNRSEKLIEYIKGFYKLVDIKKLYVVKNQFHINIIENEIIKELMIHHDKNSVRKLEIKDMKKFCTNTFESFYDRDVKKFEKNNNPQDSYITRRFMKQIIKKLT